MVDAVLEPHKYAPERVLAQADPFSGRALLALLRVIGVLPLSLRSVLGACIGYFFGLIPSRDRRFAALQLRAFLPAHNATALLPRIFANTGRTMLESLNLKPLLRTGYPNIKCADWERVTTWLAEDRPLVTLTAHTGNWDLLAAYGISRGVALTTIGREARSPTGQVVLRALREAYGIETVWRSDRSGLKRLLACLKERRVIAALLDQDTRVDSISVPFFGTPAQTPSALIGLGQKFNARFVSAFIFRTSCFGFEIFIEELDSSSSAEQLLSEYNRRLETLIRRFPSQWVWFHKRWRTQPSGLKLSSREYAEWLATLPVTLL